MPDALEIELNKLETVIDKYCWKSKKDTAFSLFNEAENYAWDFPQEDDVEWIMTLIGKIEKYISVKGRPAFKEVKNSVEKRLLNVIDKEEK